MKKAVFAGTFDPFTLGHLSILKRATAMFDQVVLAVCEKSKSGVDANRRLMIVKKSIAGIGNAKAEIFGGLLTDYMQEIKCSVLVRGLRNATDFEYEKELFAAYKSLYPDIEAYYLIADGKTGFVSSSLVRELLSYNADVSAYISKEAAADILAAYGAEV